MPTTPNQFCSKCGSPTAADARFCGVCGTPCTAATGPASAGIALGAGGMTNFTRVRQLFDQAQSIPPAQRDTWLVDECKGDPALLSELRGMLQPSGQSFLQQPAVGATAFGLTVVQQAPAVVEPPSPPPPPVAPSPAGPPFAPSIPPPSHSAPPMSSPSHSGTAAPGAAPQFVGPYRLVRELGRGGMGVVFLALRDDGAFRKNVALKVLLRDQVNEEFLLRFKQERQVVAALDHPNIARILDGGDAPDGMPYYVMEYVEGLSLDQYCDQQRLSITGRIKMFQQVCMAVHYLHQNLIVHRDLKPGNILVSNDGVVKLLDFGIAKMVGAASATNPELTSAQGSPMTPTYASPEQMQGATLQKTSDIYSLGVILYRLLTGRNPYANLDDKIAKLASREDPPLPSQNIREDLRATPESTAQLRRAMLGELDSIVLMAMRYDPRGRYQSAADLSNDLQHFLDGQSVTAHHDSMADKSIRLFKRKRAAIAVLIGFLLLGSFGGFEWWRASQQKAEAEARQAQLLEKIEKLESSTAAANPGQAPPSGEDAAKAIAKDKQDVQTLMKAFGTDFTAAIAARPGHTPERDALLTRGVSVLDRVRTSSPPDPGLGIEIADGYQQLGLLQENTSDGKNRQAAVGTYQKGAEVLGNVSAQYPDNAAAKQRLARLNDRIRTLQSGGAGTQASNVPRQEVTPQPAPEAAPAIPVPAPKPVVQTPVKVAQKQAVAPPPASTPPVNEPPVQAPPPAATPAVPPAELADVEERMANATSKVEIADQTIEPVRQSLAKTGQTLNPDTTSAMANMHSRLARAKRDIGAGDLAAAREDIAAADALAAKVLRSVGR